MKKSSLSDEVSLCFKPMTEVADLIRKRQITSVALTESILDRIGSLDATLKSYATVMADHALGNAASADREIAAGRYRGPLHGVPVAVKDLCFTAGVRTMGGTAVRADFVPAYDATVIERLRAAGAVLLGKLNLTEGAMSAYHPALDIPVNPWNAGVWAGSSSSGSGVATAAGLAYATLGSDTGGSIRFPSAACGVVGLKPTWGRVSRYGVLPLAESLDHVGPMARTTADAAIVLQVIAGHDPNDPTSLPDPVPDLTGNIGGSVQGIRIGLDERYIRQHADPAMAEAVVAGVGVLASLGARVVKVALPDLNKYVPAWPVLCSAEAVLAHEATYPSRRDDYGPWFREWLDRGSRVTGAEYARANNVRAACTGQLLTLLEEVDVLACPSMVRPPYPVTPREQYGPLGVYDPTKLRFTAPFDFARVPTLSVPSGFTDTGLPLSLQFVGRPLSEALLCRVGHAYEQATEWHLHHPDV